MFKMIHHIQLHKLIYSTFFILILTFLKANGVYAQLYLDSIQNTETRVDDLLNRMTLEEKIGQMTQIERQAFSDVTDINKYFIGSILSGGGSAPSINTGASWANMYDGFQQQAISTRLKIPLIYGIDAVHGHNNVKDAVIFPHNIGLGCTRNPELVKEAAHITAMEIMGTGLNWTFAPCVAVTRDERWGRTYEGFGETPDLVSQLGVAAIKGYQGDSLSGKSSILACAKHYLGDGGTTNGVDQGNTEVSESRLRELYLPAYIEAVNAGVGSIMPSYSSWNGLKMHANKYLLTDVLKNELGFQGFLISDWAAIDQLPGNYSSKVETSINAGLDMIMLPYNYVEFIQTVKTLVDQNKIPLSRIDDAVRRILRIKFKCGLFEHPLSDRTYTNQIGSESHRLVARECVRQSVVLLKKKDNILPLRKQNISIHVAGKNADNIGNQCGGWSISWQGSSGKITAGTTVYQAIKKVVGTGSLSYSIDGTAASGADVGIAVIGETPYAEGQGDRDDLSLSEADIATVRNLKQNNIPVIVILISGRPMLLNPILPYCDAILAAWLPGTEGDGIADILFGDYQPSGLLSNSWPEDMSQVPVNYGDAVYAPLFNYGYGITTLSNNPISSSPEYFSSQVLIPGDEIEISFNKPMSDPSSDFAGFTVQKNSTNLSVINAKLKDYDPTTLILSLSDTINKKDIVKIKYMQGHIKSVDNGLLNSFALKSVYNLLDENMVHDIPGLVEAEEFYAMSGIQTENTSDVGGGMNVGWIDSGDWMDYLINVPVDGIYRIDMRTSCLTASGQINIENNGILLVSVSVPVTSGWQNWTTVSTTCKLDKGLNKIRLYFKTGGLNINWMLFKLVSEIIHEDDSLTFQLNQNEPNPLAGETSIGYQIPLKTNVQLALYDMLGHRVALLVNEVKLPGNYNFTLKPNVLGIKNGTYIYELKADKFVDRKKLIIKSR